MKTFLIIVGSIVLVILIFFAFMYFQAVRGGAQVASAIEDKIQIAINAIKNGQQINKAELDRLAHDPVTRNYLLQNLRDIGREDLFPAEYLDTRHIAESDLVSWLMHPSELDAAPDEIELVKVISKVIDGMENEFYVFKFRKLGDHWAAKDGWTAGIAGPYAKNGKATPFPEAVFSQFEKIEARTPEEHLDTVLKIINRVK